MFYNNPLTVVRGFFIGDGPNATHMCTLALAETWKNYVSGDSKI